MKYYQAGGKQRTKTPDELEAERAMAKKKVVYPPIKTPIDSGTVKQKSKDKIYEMQSGGIPDIYRYGYKDNSPYKHLPSITIPSNQITMEGVSKPIMATLDNGQQHIMQPNKNYFFPNTRNVRETPMQTGGQQDPTQELLMAYFQQNQMSEEQIQQFMQEFQGMSPEEQQQVLQYIQQELQGGQEQPEMPSQEMQEQPQEMMMSGGMMLRQPEYYQTGGFLIPAQTGMTAQGAPIVNFNPVNVPVNGMTLKADNLTYAEEPKKAPLAEKKKELRKAEQIYERGQTVRQVQELLVKEGFDIGKNSKGLPDIDGLLGNKTAAALEMYRKNKGLSTTDWKSTFKELTGNAPIAAKVVSNAPVQQAKVNEIVTKAVEKPLPDDYYKNYKTGYVAGLKEKYEASVKKPEEYAGPNYPKYLKNKQNDLQNKYDNRNGHPYKRSFIATDKHEGTYKQNVPEVLNDTKDYQIVQDEKGVIFKIDKRTGKSVTINPPYIKSK